ncbi:beta-1,4-N-acetylgalactosaminyltransferase bre-4-like isoform X5 [Eriocheir sinensis]|nr:beta-1,4-N-acetylgalactosaminyltransferase bre-4-like isoform X5 [Eriocheir sinensis]XP_050738621.1 beta-1,4-N-acetylgalactosaminyltransferase bre-4-like isoform X5 [Eriocheir sinensis]XP_050738622.1 beta-1,4-N-acetylgalactosaminyltransferase bre-4-like isoform X5 [Eriocheir sinensis]
MKEVAATDSRAKRCPATVRAGSCLRLLLLTFVTLVIGHLLLYYNGITLSTYPGSVVPNSAFQITWFNPSLLDGQEKHGFLNIGGEAGEDAAILVDPAVPAADGGGENGAAHTARRPCPADPPGLVGRLRVERNPPSLEEQERTHPELTKGGHYWPRNCTALHKVAIIIPYRDRRSHLAALVHHLHPFLQRQLIEYNIYVVEQAGNGPFNRGMLMNVGFTEALQQFPYDCILLHDVDLVPEDDRNLYTCPQPPRHMSALISSHHYRLIYPGYFGGVSAMTTDQFRAINGFSNEFWGWGAEDDDLFKRVRHKKLNISRYPGELGRYTMLSHKKAEPNPTSLLFVSYSTSQAQEPQSRREKVQERRPQQPQIPDPEHRAATPVYLDARGSAPILRRPRWSVRP